MNYTATTPITPSGRISQPGEPSWEVAFLFPVQGQWSEDEYLALDSNRMVELSDGCLEVLPTPTILHQLIVAFLHEQLHNYVKANATGLVLFAPLPVHLWPGTYREPDIIYLGPSRVPKKMDYPKGADLVMEVVSQGDENRDRDLRVKRQEYARAGIAEYWIVDPQQQQITVLALEGQTYRVHGEFARASQATSNLLPGFTVNVDKIFAAAETAGQ
jgi:Uma2 family endonuclease